MSTEKVNRVEVLDSGKCFVGILGDGKPMYQYVYREGKGVYWDPVRKGFISTEMKEWTASQWFAHILEIVQSLGVTLVLAETVVWGNIPENEQILIRNWASNGTAE